MRIRQLVACLVLAVLASSVEGQARRGRLVVPPPPPPVVGVLSVAVVPMGDQLYYRAGFSLPFPLPVGTKGVPFLLGPNQERVEFSAFVRSQAQANLGVAGWFFGGYNWGQALPASWPKTGIATFGLELKGPGVDTTFTHQVLLGDPQNRIGPLESAEVYPDGMIFFKGSFQTTPIAAIDGRVSEVVGGCWIRPPNGYAGVRMVTLCTQSNPRQCSTVIRELPDPTSAQ